MTQQLYRLFNADDELLYIGVSRSAMRRITEHAQHQPWWLEVARVDIETHEVERSVIEAMEREAIQAERPKYNKQHAKTASVAATPTSLPYNVAFKVGDVVAIGLRGKPSCPVGAVVEMNADGIVLDLYQWSTGTFGYQQTVVRPSQFKLATKAQPMTERDKKRHGYSGSGRVFDMDPLADFQRMWKEPYQ